MWAVTLAMKLEILLGFKLWTINWNLIKPLNSTLNIKIISTTMSHTINPRDVLEYLNELGYQNVTADQLKEFMRGQ